MTSVSNTIRLPSRLKKRDVSKKKPIGYLVPSLIILLVVQVYPSIYSFYLSLGKMKGGRYSFVGFNNFTALFRTSDFYESLGRTAIFTVSYLFLCISVGMVLALLLNRRTMLTSFYLTCIFIPSIISEVVGGTMWRWLFQQSYGIVQVALNPLLNNYSMLSGSTGAMIIVIVVSVWQRLAFVALIYLGAMQTIPHELNESAALDGASSWQIFWGITLPIIRPAVLITVLLTSIRGINALGLILATTKGGPGAATMTTAMYLYRTAWSFGDFGTAATLSVIMFFVNIVLTVIYLRMFRMDQG